MNFSFRLKKCGILLAVAFLLTSAFGEEETPTKLSEKYPDLSEGILREAFLEDLAQDVLVSVEGKEITREMLADRVARSPEDVRAEAEKYQFHTLEDMITSPIMMIIILADEDFGDDNELMQQKIRDYIDAVIAAAEVSEDEARRFFYENPGMFTDKKFEDVKEMLVMELTRQRQRQAWDAHIRDMGRKVKISINAEWTAEQVEKVRDNPVDKARAEDKVVLAVFSADWCPACKQLKPVLESLQSGKLDETTVVIIDTDENGFLASRYNVSNIPLLIFFDRNGVEVERHAGFMSEENILAKIKAAASVLK